MKKERIDKFLSSQLNISRSESRTSIRRGNVSVNGITVKDVAYLITPGVDTVTSVGGEVKYRKFIYLIMNKPAGVITASSDKTRETVLDFVPERLRRHNLAPVGRLDKDTTGLLIFTDDGEFAHKCISPKNKIEKSYIAELDGDVDENIIAQFEKGVVLSDGYRCKPAKLKKLENRRAQIVITEGKYHQIKRMFGVFSLGVNVLHRVSVGGLKLSGNLRPGECVEVPDIGEFIAF